VAADTAEAVAADTAVVVAAAAVTNRR